MTNLNNLEKLATKDQEIVLEAFRKNQQENAQDAHLLERNNQLLQDFIDNRYQKDNFSFDVISDPHTSIDTIATQRFIDALKELPYLNPLSSTLLIPGDFADGGKEEEYVNFFKLLETYHAVHPLVSLGNHDVRWQDDHEVYKKRYFENNGKYMGDALKENRLYWDDYVNDYHFIILNTELDLKDNAYLSKKQLDWFKQTIEKDADNQKPIFVTIHQTFKGTADHIDQDWIYDSKQYPKNHPDQYFNHEEALKEILRPYAKRVFIFTGHVHNGRDLLKIYHMDYGHIVDLPSFVRADYGEEGHSDTYEVTVKGNEVIFDLYNYHEHRWIPKKQEIVKL